MTDEELNETSENGSEETSEVGSENESEETSEESSEETSEPSINAETLQSIDSHLEAVHGLMFVGIGFLIFFFLLWLVLKIEKMLETYF